MQFKSIILKFHKSTFLIKEELNIKISSNNFSALLRVVLKNKEMTVELLKDLTKLNITDFEFEDLKNMGDLSGYDFSIIKLKAFLGEANSKDNKTNEKKTNDNEMINRKTEDEANKNSQTEEEANKNIQTDLYIKMIRKDRIKESIFCYWSLLYDEKFKNYEESEFTSVINKVRITETESEEYKHSVLLEIKENKWGILEYGSTIHLVKFEKYLNDKTVKKSKLTNEWKKYLEAGNQDVLFIGVVN